MTDPAARYRRLNWYGLKPRVKALLGFPFINGLARPLVRPLAARGGLWASFPVSVPEVSGEAGDARFALLEPMRCSIARELYWGGGRRLLACERFALDLFCRLAREADVVLDVGANTGIFAVAAAAANPAARVRAYELVPEVFELLVRNVRRNGASERVACFNVGVGADGKKVRLPDVSSGASLPQGFSTGWTGGAGREVPLASLDSLVEELRPLGRRFLMKIDVEGTEDEVFRHGERFLDAFGPDMLCELLPDCANVAFIEPLLRARGYRFLRVEDGRLEEKARLEPHAAFHDWLLTKRAL